MWRRPPWLGHFLRLAAVNVLSNLMVPLAGLLDVAFLGHHAAVHDLAGVALSTIICNYLYWSFGFLRMGTTGMTAQAVGREDEDEVWAILWRNLAIALLVGGAIVLWQWPIQQLGFALLSATAAVKQSGVAYFSAMVWGAPPTLLNYVLIGWLLGRGESRRVLGLSIISSFVNVLLNYWLIVQLGWASAGAGYATAVSQYVTLLAGGLMLAGRSSGIVWCHERQRLFDRERLRHTFQLNGNIMLRTLALLTAFGLFSNISSAISPAALALNTLLLQVVTINAYFIDGYAYATETYAGQFYGRGETGKMWQLLQIAIGLGVITAIVLSSLFIFRSQVLLRLLTKHEYLIAQSSTYVVWLLPVLAWGAVAYVLDGYFLGLGAGRTLRNSTIVATVCGFLPIALLGWRLQNLQLLWCAMTMFMALRAITLSLRLKSSLR